MKHLYLIILSVSLFTGCGSKVLMPYESEPLCKRGMGEGMCGSVSQVYQKTVKQHE